LPVTATVGGISAPVNDAGRISLVTASGVYEVNMQVPNGISPGLQEVVVIVGGKSAAVKVAVQ